MCIPNFFFKNQIQSVESSELSEFHLTCMLYFIYRYNYAKQKNETNSWRIKSSGNIEIVVNTIFGLMKHSTFCFK